MSFGDDTLDPANFDTEARARVAESGERYTAAELKLLGHLAANEGAERIQDQTLLEAGSNPMFVRGLGQIKDDGVDCLNLAKRLREHAEELERGGPYR